MRILVTGSRDWADTEVIETALYREYLSAPPGVIPTLVHGGCPTGADQIAHDIWTTKGLPAEVHPADWSKGRSAGPARNQHMVNLGADVCLAFIQNRSRGATHCAKAAIQAGITVHIFRKETSDG